MKERLGTKLASSTSQWCFPWAWFTCDLELKHYLVRMNCCQVLEATKCYLAIARGISTSFILSYLAMKGQVPFDNV